MYSPVVVAGSNTHNMPQTKKTNNNKQKMQVQHAFRGVRDVLVEDASVVGSKPVPLTTGAQGTVSYNGFLSCSGMNTVPLGAATASYANTVYLVTPPRMNWLLNTSKNFGSFRVTRANLVFIGNVGSTATGKVVMFASRDVVDVSQNISVSTSQGGKVFDLASAATRELRIPMPVDPSWKKVTNVTCVRGDSYPWGGDASSVIQINSVNDLIFSAFAVTVVGGPANADIGSLLVEYDVEFRDPISISINR